MVVGLGAPLVLNVDRVCRAWTANFSTAEVSLVSFRRPLPSLKSLRVVSVFLPLRYLDVAYELDGAIHSISSTYLNVHLQANLIDRAWSAL